MKKLLKLFIVTVLAVGALAFNSCSKDDENPNYVGTWTISVTEEGVTTERQLILTKSTIDMKILLANAEMLGQKGSLSVSGNKMTIKVTEVRQLDALAGKVVTYKEGSAEFKERYPDAASQTNVGTYVVAGNKLTLTTKNDAGKEEVEVYTKK